MGMGTHIHLGRTGSTLCPVSAVLVHLAIRPSAPGPLFIFQNGTPLTRGQLVSQLRKALCQAGVNNDNFSGHSFRIGAATTAAHVGLNDSVIQTLGRWWSSVYTAYIRTPDTVLIAASSALASLNDTTEVWGTDEQ